MGAFSLIVVINLLNRLSMTEVEVLSASTEGSLDNLGPVSKCKITALPNPVALDSGLVALPDYACKRVIQRKKRPSENKDNRLSVAASSVASSVTNLDSISMAPSSANGSSLAPEDHQEKKIIQFVDEFSAPFSWMPQNGFSYFSITCSSKDTDETQQHDHAANDSSSSG